MWIALSAVLSVAFILALVKWILLRRELTAIAERMAELVPGQSNRQIRVNTQDSAVLKLANKVNKLYDDVDALHAKHVLADDELRQNMADISHDLRTPITSVLGYLRLLSKPDSTQDQREEYLAVATRRAESLRNMVDSLFQLARLESGVHRFELEPLDASEFLAQELAAGYTAFAGAGLVPEISLPGEAMYILSDRQATQRIFANLLQNMLQHGSGGIGISAESRDESVAFRFSNRAENLTAESVTHIFDRSYTGDSARNTRRSGLGLAIAYQFVHQTGGIISAALQDGVLTITVAWPRIRP